MRPIFPLSLLQYLSEFYGSWVFSEFLFESRSVMLCLVRRVNGFDLQWGKLMSGIGDSAVRELS